ncbi:MAG: family N-acetyltransferase [Frankiales bacterium]|nr:family N-acetyltransferase [Frankiales bacterium]
MTREREAVLQHWRRDALTRPAGAVLDLGDAQAHSTGIAVPQWNGLLLRRVPEDAGLYAEAAAWFAGRGMPYGVVVPEELDHAPPGATLRHDLPVLRRSLADLPPLPRLAYDDAPTAAVVADVQAAAFEDLPALDLAFVAPVLSAPWRRTVVVAEEGEPVATACVSLGGEREAVVFDVAVLPRAQRRGLGRAVTLWCLHEAASAGADLVVLNPSDAGRALYAGLDFVPAPSWRIWRPATLPA